MRGFDNWLTKPCEEEEDKPGKCKYEEVRNNEENYCHKVNDVCNVELKCHCIWFEEDGE